MFTKVFTLVIDDATLKHRLLTRENNMFGKHPLELAQQLDWSKRTIQYARQRGTVVIDAGKPLAEVVDEIVKGTI